MKFHLRRGADQEDAESFLFLLRQDLHSNGYDLTYIHDNRKYSATIKDRKIHPTTMKKYDVAEFFRSLLDDKITGYFNKYFILDRETENFSVTYIPGAVTIVEDCEYDAF